MAKTRVLKRITKNDSALHKHIQWLKELQEDRRKVDEKKELEEAQRLKRRSEFMEREAKKRLLKRAAKEEALRDVEEEDDEILPSSLLPQCTTASSSADETYSSMKPAWCQSEEAAESAQEMAEINDEADLLDFVHDLDFDQYDQDLELQVLMGQVKDRIKKLQREKKKDETTLQTCVDVSDYYICAMCAVIVITSYSPLPNYNSMLPSTCYIYRVKMQRLELKSWITRLLLISYPQTSRQMRKNTMMLSRLLRLS